MKRQVEAVMPTRWGKFRMLAYAEDSGEKMPHLAMIHTDFDPTKPVMLRIHSECMTGDLFGSKRCDCGEQLDESLRMAAENGGVVIYLRQEGRGIGLINKLKAYNLQDTGLNTADANTHLGFKVDARAYSIAVEMMQDLGIQSIHLITNNPLKIEAIDESAIKVVSRIPLVMPPQQENIEYFRTKEIVMGHLFHVNGKGTQEK